LYFSIERTYIKGCRIKIQNTLFVNQLSELINLV
jgi:hypothetical protein